MTVRLEILGDDGEWHEVRGVTNVEFHPAEQPDDFKETRRPRVIDQDGRPVRPRADRPAWQPPYGPPTRRR